MTSTAATDPEKAPQRDSSQIERPPSIHSLASSSDHDRDHDREHAPDKDHHGHASDPAAEDPAGPLPEASRVSSRRPPPVVVPRASRRGLLARLAFIPEVEDPYAYSNKTKWSITVIIAFATAAAPLGSTIFYPALPTLSAELGATNTVTNLSVALYLLAMSIFPLWWSAFSEQYGRRSIYLVSFSLFVIFSVVSALSTNITMLIVFRICGGGASASVQAVGAGTVADIWESFERGRAMGWFYLGALLGPLIGPIIGGVLTRGLGWQSTMWCLAIYGLVVFLLLTFFLPETLAQKKPEEQPLAPDMVNLQRTSTLGSAKVKTKRLGAALKRFLIDPLSVLLFLRFPPLLLTVFIAAIAFSALFVANISIQQKFSAPPYNFSASILGLLYIPPGLGYFLSSMFGGRWIDHIMAREARKANRYDEHGKLIYLPEDRMRENMWVANSVYPLSLLAYGWTLRYGVHFMVPSVCLFIFGGSSMLVFSAATTMLTEFVRKKSSAGVAINNFVRNILSCIGAIVAAPWIEAIDVGWVMTCISIFCLASGFAGIILLRRNARRWRETMEVALNDM
ncbi:major facilitator superfamily domain-containing protein [Stachybotrys elegans]|uniref:Major facilitator superfamily domain-containing protein n=1 Tax=Stachybotrys elegans TaxID=80388 RepID=A0A8K0T4J7_9HYPO|nr:major facilitator superfamily domain-containing protein [Stachybotrys elegans]